LVKVKGEGGFFFCREEIVMRKLSLASDLGGI
jgi:hypothetical protein